MGLSNLVSRKFKDSFESKCYLLLVDAYNMSVKEGHIKLTWDENDISSELLRHMEANPIRIDWRIFTQVEYHIPTPIERQQGFAAQFSRIDFRMSVFNSNLQHDYFFEAKNLKETSSALKRRYIDTGINSFTTKKYNNGSLVGYLLEGYTTKTIDGINSLLEKDGKVDESLVAKSNSIHTYYYESTHLSIGTLKHLIFDFTNLSN